ncbi:Superoxide dismutase [Cu-Zn] [Lamellibrachia satsuma]|nr:Superoxide dismutase [Cu-Zn] [Lamellibrachia satsuma]
MLLVGMFSCLLDSGRCTGDLKDAVSMETNKLHIEAFSPTVKRPLKLEAKGESLVSFIYGRCSVRPDPTNSRLADFVVGTIDLRQPLQGGPTEIRLSLTGFNRLDKRRLHGVQVHQFGDLADGCRSAGGHYNPFDVTHGSPADLSQFKHFGDLGTIEESNNGTVEHTLKDYFVSLLGPFSVLGRAAVRQREHSLASPPKFPSAFNIFKVRLSEGRIFNGVNPKFREIFASIDIDRVTVTVRERSSVATVDVSDDAGLLKNERLDGRRRWMFRVAFALCRRYRLSLELDRLATRWTQSKHELGTEQI